MSKIFKPLRDKFFKSLITFVTILALSQASDFVADVHAYIDRWEVIDNGGNPVATDCGDCEEETGIIIDCVDKGLPAKVTVNGTAAQNGKDGASSPVSFNIDGEIFIRNATTVEYGLIGFTPVFDLPLDDPLIYALQSGRSATVFFNNEKSLLSLKGSGDALDTFKQGCGWNQVQEKQQIQQQIFGVQPGEVHTQPNQDGLLWYTASYDLGTENATYELRYAIPETDAIAMIATCKTTNTSTYEVKFMINYGTAKKGQLINLTITDDEQSQVTKQAFVFEESSESAGVHLFLSPQDDFWTQLTKTQSFSVRVEGQPSIPLPGAANAGEHFLSQCK